MSATRPYSDMKNAIIKTMVVETGQTVSVGRVVKYGTNDNNCQHAGANELGFGVVVAVTSSGAAGERVQVALLAGAVIIPVVVGTGGATHGKLAKNAANGLTDATPDFNTPSATYVHGYFLQSGVAGDIVGLLPAPAWITE